MTTPSATAYGKFISGNLNYAFHRAFEEARRDVTNPNNPQLLQAELLNLLDKHVSTSSELCQVARDNVFNDSPFWEVSCQATLPPVTLPFTASPTATLPITTDLPKSEELAVSIISEKRLTGATGRWTIRSGLSSDGSFFQVTDIVGIFHARRSENSPNVSAVDQHGRDMQLGGGGSVTMRVQAQNPETVSSGVTGFLDTWGTYRRIV